VVGNHGPPAKVTGDIDIAKAFFGNGLFYRFFGHGN
jgi:hypothetical protein